jgi:MFS family permease
MSVPSAESSVLATRRGKLVLVVLCTGAFVDFVDTSIVNVALPSIRDELRMSVSALQWVANGYVLTYGGLTLLGGRLADLVGRRRTMVAGISIVGISSAAAGLAPNGGFLIGTRFAQGCGAALMLPAALSILITTFRARSDRSTAIGVWGGISGLGAAAGVLLSGLLTEGPGWRWVFYVNVPVCIVVLIALPVLVSGDDRRAGRGGFDLVGTVPATGGLMLLVYALVTAPGRGWGSTGTVVELVAAVVLPAGFVINEHRTANPLLPLTISRVRGLAAANLTQMLTAAAAMPMFFVVTLYARTVLGYGPIAAGTMYLPFSLTAAAGAGIGSKIYPRAGARAVSSVGAVLLGVGPLLLSRIPTHGSYLHDLLPGMIIMAGRDLCRQHRRRQCRCAAGPGRAGGGAAEHRPATRYRPRIGGVHRAVRLAGRQSAGARSTGVGSGDGGLSRRTVGRRGDRVLLRGGGIAHDQRARRTSRPACRRCRAT